VPATPLDEGRYIKLGGTICRMPAADGSCRERRTSAWCSGSHRIGQTASGVNAPQH